MRGRAGKQIQNMTIVEASPLRRLEARAKLVMALCASLMVMLPLERLAAFILFYSLFLAWARLIPATARQIWRIKWVLLVLFILDVWLINLELAVTVTLRLSMLAGVFSLLFATTTPAEFTLALENMRLPYRYAFSLGLAFQSLNLIEEEWQNIQEAQQARGALRPVNNWREGLRQVRDLVALTVPAVVLTTKRAWAATEAAYARGFDSPRRMPYQRLHFKNLDGVAILLALLASSAFLFWPAIWSILAKI